MAAAGAIPDFACRAFVDLYRIAEPDGRLPGPEAIAAALGLTTLATIRALAALAERGLIEEDKAGRMRLAGPGAAQPGGPSQPPADAPIADNIATLPAAEQPGTSTKRVRAHRKQKRAAREQYEMRLFGEHKGGRAAADETPPVSSETTQSDQEVAGASANSETHETRPGVSPAFHRVSSAVSGVSSETSFAGQKLNRKRARKRPGDAPKPIHSSVDRFVENPVEVAVETPSQIAESVSSPHETRFSVSPAFHLKQDETSAENQKLNSFGPKGATRARVDPRRLRLDDRRSDDDARMRARGPPINAAAEFGPGLFAQALDLVEPLMRLCGIDPADAPNGWQGIEHDVTGLLAEGWTPVTMLDAVRRVMGRKHDGPPTKFAYIVKALGRERDPHFSRQARARGPP